MPEFVPLGQSKEARVHHH